MKRTERTKWFVGIMVISSLMLTACSEGGDGDLADVRSSISASSALVLASYNGEWTVNFQVVDTARLDVSDVLRVRLPETFLAHLCFSQSAADYASSEKSGVNTDGETTTTSDVKPLGLPTKIEIKDQGYTNEAVFSNFCADASVNDGTTVYKPAYFLVTINGTKYLVELLSTEEGSAIQRLDNGGWTLAITVNGFCVTNTENFEEKFISIPPFTLCYNTKERIR